MNNLLKIGEQRTENDSTCFLKYDNRVLRMYLGTSDIDSECEYEKDPFVLLDNQGNGLQHKISIFVDETGKRVLIDCFQVSQFGEETFCGGGKDSKSCKQKEKYLGYRILSVSRREVYNAKMDRKNKQNEIRE